MFLGQYVCMVAIVHSHVSRQTVHLAGEGVCLYPGQCNSYETWYCSGLGCGPRGCACVTEGSKFQPGAAIEKPKKVLGVEQRGRVLDIEQRRIV